MPGLGSILGAFGQAYPKYQQQQNTLSTDDMERQIKQQQLKQALTQMAQQQANQKAQAQALQSMAGATPSGPGGTYSPQQRAQFANGSPEAYNLTKPDTGMYNLAGRDISGQYGLERSQQTGQNQMDVQDLRNQGNQAVQGMRNRGATDVQGLRNTGAQATQGLRNQGATAVQGLKNERPAGAGSPASLTNTPEYKTAKSEYDQAKNDERAIERNYQMEPGKAYSDPQWMDARKRSLAAQQKMESIQTKAAKAAPAAPAGPPQIKTDDDFNKLPSGTQFVDPEGNVRAKP